MPERAAMESMAEYVAGALPVLLAARGIDWMVRVDASREGISSYLLRGDLRVAAAVHHGGTAEGESKRRRAWWEPVSHENAQRILEELAWRLILQHALVRDADETGRLHAVVWRDSTSEDQYHTEPAFDREKVVLVLEPGFSVEPRALGELAGICKLDAARPITVAEALILGCARRSEPEAVRRP